jgi:hypothetical protein
VRTRPKDFRRGWKVAVAALSLAGVIVVVITVQHRPSPLLTARSGTPSAAEVVYSVPQLSYSPIQQLVGDPAGAGAWFWDYTKTEDTVFHVSQTGSVQSWPVLTGSDYVGASGSSGLAVANDGTVWLGINSTLLRLDPSTSQVQTWTIPTASDNAAAESFMPPNMVGMHPVTSIAVNPSDTAVAIAEENANAVEIFDVTTGNYSSLALPSQGDIAVALAYSGDGTLAVGLSNISAGGSANQLLLVSNGSDSTATLPAAGSSWSTAPEGSNSFIVGSVTPSVVSETGQTTTLATPGNLLGSPIGNSSAPLGIVNGNSVGIVSSGVEEFPIGASSVAAAAAAATTVQMPAVNCPSNVAGSAQQSGTSSAGSTAGCAAPTPNMLATDAAGNIWTVIDGGSIAVAPAS